jgi:pimeloyl-ACP methyl ester carboxylesterase
MTTTTADPQARTLEAPGATIAYDVRPNETSTATPLFILGSPMGASGFVALASLFLDRTVITYDPRGAERSTKADPSTESTPQQHAEDIHAVIQATGLGPVDLFASSGGAVNALALVAAHPDDVRTLVAHEPPLAAILPDAENAKAAVRGIQRSYQEGGFGKGMAHFIAVVGYKGEFPDGFGDQPGPDPAMFGLPAGDDGSRNDVLLAQNIITCTHFRPDFEALAAASTRVIPAAGVDVGTMANRGAHAVAERLGVPVADFPGGHGGFLPVEWGQGGDPDAFAARLREVLDSAS